MRALLVSSKSQPEACQGFLHLRTNDPGTANGPVHLLVSDYDSGIRLFGEE